MPFDKTSMIMMSHKVMAVLPFEITAPILVIFLAWLSFMHFTTKRRAKKDRKNYLENLQIFKQNADKILVDLDDCKIKQRIHYAKIRKTDRQQLRDVFDSHIFGIHRKDAREVIQSTVIYEVEINGKMETFCAYVDKEESTLRLLFALQKTTYIYVSRNDREEYYFDLEFLVSE